MARSNSAWFYNVPSFVVARDQVIDMPGYGPVTYDLAFGGAFYAYVDTDQAPLSPGKRKLPQPHQIRHGHQT